MAMTKAEKSEMEALRRHIRELLNDVEVLRGTVKVDVAVGDVLLQGYGDEPLPLGPYFRVAITSGQSAGLEVSMSQGLLSVRCINGFVAALPSSSNVMRFVRAATIPGGDYAVLPTPKEPT